MFVVLMIRHSFPWLQHQQQAVDLLLSLLLISLLPLLPLCLLRWLPLDALSFGSHI